MDVNRIKAILEDSSSTILSAESFSERMDMVYEILDKAFPRISATAAVYGPITSLTGFMSRTEIEPLLEVIKKSSKSNDEYVTTDSAINDILRTIYVLINSKR